MPDAVTTWIAGRTYAARVIPPPAALRALLGDHSITLIVPALGEVATIGRNIRALVEHAEVRALIDDVVVIDGGSEDATCQLAAAAAAGARVLRSHDIATQQPSGGKGGSVWRALQATGGGRGRGPSTPISTRSIPRGSACSSRRCSWTRPCTSSRPRASVLSRWTQSCTRAAVDGSPSWWRVRCSTRCGELAGIIQPLSGEFAARRDLLERLPIATGYGLEIGLLVDTLNAVGLDAIAQVDLGERRHRHQSDLALGRMASAVLRTALGRAGLPHLPEGLLQFAVDDRGDRVAVQSLVQLQEMPPVATLCELQRWPSASGARSCPQPVRS